MNTVNGALLTDLYQFNMIQAYLDHGRCDMAVFEFFVRRLPPQHGFLLLRGWSSALISLKICGFRRKKSHGSAEEARARLARLNVARIEGCSMG